MFNDFSILQIAITCFLFVWAGFVRTGLGFGGAALGLPLLLFVSDQPLFWLPLISVHLLFFSGMTLFSRLGHVDWGALRKTAVYIVPPFIIGVFGLVNFPALWLNIFIYAVTLFYGVMWFTQKVIESHHNWVDKLLLMVGGYIAGVSLTGAPLMVAVFMRRVRRGQLRDTLFVLWFVLVGIKMSTFIALRVNLHFTTALLLLPVAAIGHVLGLKVHDAIAHNDRAFKRWMGGGVVIVSLLGLWDQLAGVVKI